VRHELAERVERRATWCETPQVIAHSIDGSDIYYEVTGNADTALVFVHGWMGNVRWWDAQRDAFAPTHRVVTLDLAGHGRSSRTRTSWTAATYADDIRAVIAAVAAPRVVLVAHSMAGGYAVEAVPEIANLAGLVLVDTLKDLDAMPPAAQVDAMLAGYRANYRGAVESILPGFLFAPTTPPAVVERLTGEFLAVTGEVAATLIEPLYRFDVRAAAKRVRVPVRAIGTDLHPYRPDANRAYFADYQVVTIPGFGHYPMLEAPDAFNAALRDQLIAFQ
jgi:sigma-B regulation protein RsbQ